MRAMPEGYERKGKVVTFTLDEDAWLILKAEAPTQKAYGRFISELIRRNAIRKDDLARWRASQETLLVEVGQDND